MKRNGMKKCTSLVLVLCLILTCMSFAFTGVGAATVDNAAEVSAPTAGDDNFTWDNASVYFLLTDRFKNGKTSNDHSYGRATDANGNPLSGWDTAPGTFHGGDFVGITQALNDGYFTDLGINAIWISAPYEQIHGYVDSGKGFAHYSYHGYYVLDYTNTDANFGTPEEFETLVDTAHSKGIRVIIDIVMNHTGYNNVADMEEYNYGTLLSGASEFKYQLNNVGDVNSHIDFKTSADDWGRWWGTQWIRSGLPGYTPEGGSDLTRSLEGLPDFMTESTATVDIPPLLKTKWELENRLEQETNELDTYLQSKGKTRTVTNTLSYWLSTWVRDYGVDGFRCDTAKHVDLASWNTLKTTCVDALKQWRKNNPNKPGADWDEDFWMTGECWDHNLGWGYDSYYTQGGFDSMINFETTGGGMLAQSKLAGVYSNYADSINSNDKFNQLSYISSHDSTLARGDMIYLGSALMMLPGGIQVFYGDETNRPLSSNVGFDGNGGSGHSLRSDMNWNNMDEKVLAHWQKVGTFRNDHVSIGAGQNIELNANSGVAFGRTYSKNGVEDKAAAVVGAGANSTITIDVSKLWNDGQALVNAYDQSSSVVSGGKVTFNSGANGTILIQEPDGRPVMSVQGAPKFKGSQTVTVSLQECDYAKCSVDGGNKFIVKDGDKFTIGGTAYDGDTIKVVLEAENERGSSKSVATFQKVSADEPETEPTTNPAKKAELHVKALGGTAPYAYVWTGTNTEHNGAWPGKQMTEKDSEGNYVLYIDTTEKFNVVMNNGGGSKSGDITNLYGVTYLEVANDYTTKVVSTETPGGGGDDPTDESVSIRVKTYDGNPVNLYVWNGNVEFNGAWPGAALSEKDADGYYVFNVQNASTCSAIVNKNGSQSDDITGLSGDVIIEIKSADCKSVEVTQREIPLSGMALLRQEAREVKAMTATDYTTQSFAALIAIMPAADALIAQGETADETAVQNAIDQLKTAKAALKLAAPKLTYAVAGKSQVKGIAVPAADVTVNVNGTDYKTTADDVTGAFTVNAAITSSSTIKINVTRNDKSADTYTYSMSNGNIQNGEEPTSPTQPQTQPTTQPQTQPTTQPSTTEPVVEKLTVNAGSNVFPAATQTFNKEEGKVTVTYKLNVNMGVVDTQWKLTYDTSKLRYSRENNMSNNKQTIMPNVDKLVFNAKNDYIKGNFSEVASLYEYNGGTFVSVTFDIIGTGTADVYLDLECLTLGYHKSPTDLVLGSLVDRSQMFDISGQAGFENVAVSSNTLITGSVVKGDVNGDGVVDIQDATLVMKNVVEIESFTSMQFLAADVDGDGVITTKDATCIQKYVAELITSF